MADAERPTKRQRLNAELSNADLDDICCSICTEPFVDPVLLRGTGHTYCRTCITQALASQRRCPLSNARITIPRRGGVDGVLDPNHQVRSMMDAQRVACAHAARGCTERPKLGDVDAHEASCAFAPKKCARCPFLGSRAETEAHERSCPYVVLGPVLDAQANRIQSLERRVTEQDRTNERLAARLDALERSARTVTPVSARRPPRDVVEHWGLTFDAGRCFRFITLSDDETAARGSGDAVASEVFDSGKHCWKLRFPATDRWAGVGICTEDRDIGVALHLYKKYWARGKVDGGSWISRPERIHTVAQIPWRRDFGAGSVLDVSFNCDTGTLSVGLAGSDGVVSLTVDELVSKRVSPFVFLTSGNTCRFVDY